MEKFAACVYDEELDGYVSFFEGTRDQAEQKAQRMASLLGTQFLPDPKATDDFDAKVGATCVRPVGDPDIQSHAHATVEDTTHNAYGAQAIKVTHAMDDASPEEDDPGFVPVKPSGFKAGDQVLLAQAVYNNPGGVRVVDPGMTRVEYWQANTFFDGELN